MTSNTASCSPHTLGSLWYISFFIIFKSLIYLGGQSVKSNHDESTNKEMDCPGANVSLVVHPAQK